MQAALRIREVSQTYHNGASALIALDGLSLDVAQGELACLLGASGCGKSTLLNLIAGVYRLRHGAIEVGGRRVALMFQEPALFPWLNVEDNVAFGLRQHAGMSAAERRSVARDHLRLVHLQGFERAFVHELSGGMKQRAALARALAPRPRALLCDEPFGSLDALTRERLYAELQELHARTRRTTLFVTHNTREAACLADRVVVLTERPATIASVLPVELPRPRDFYDPRVSELAGEILAKLRSDPAPSGGSHG